jgi:hypothetical protein
LLHVISRLKGEVNVGTGIFSLVLGISIASFFMWQHNNALRREYEIERGIYPKTTVNPTEAATRTEKNEAKLPELSKIVGYPRRGKQPRPLFGPFVYRDDRRPNLNRRS